MTERRFHFESQAFEQQLPDWSAIGRRLIGTRVPAAKTLYDSVPWKN
jgi:hypothetical protein